MGILERSKDGKHAQCVQRWFLAARRRPFSPKSASTLKQAALYTDALQPYNGLDEFEYGVIDRAVEYVDGRIHTNGLENFWSLLKRGANGTYVSVEPFHLLRYLDEQACRFSNRKVTDAECFDMCVKRIVGKRLTFDRFTGNACAFAEAEAGAR
jgi:hypothetical protein